MVTVITDLVMPMVTTAIGATATGATGAEVTHPMAIAMVWAREVQEDIEDIT